MPRLALAALCLLLAAPARGAEERPLRLPDFDTAILDNGLVVHTLVQREVPLVSACLLVPAGAVHDDDRPGRAFLAAEGLLFGTAERSKEDLEEELDFLGVELRVAAGKECTRLSLSFLARDLDRVLELLAGIARAPAYPECEVVKRRERLLAEMEQEKEWPSEVVGLYFDRFLFGDHPLGNPVRGTPAGVRALARDDLACFHAARYRPGGSVLALAGDLDPAAARAAVAKRFGSWAGAAGDASPPPPKPLEKTRVLLVNKDDAEEVQFMAGGFAPPRADPDRAAAELVNTVFGGRFTSWLNDELRVTRGLTYGAEAWFARHRAGGSFVLHSYTETAKAAEALTAALALLETLHAKGLDEAALASARAYCKGQFPPLYETTGALADTLATLRFHGLDRSEVDGYAARLDAVTVERARAVIARGFPRAPLCVVLVGRAEALRAFAATLGAVTEKPIAAEGY